MTLRNCTTAITTGIDRGWLFCGSSIFIAAEWSPRKRNRRTRSPRCRSAGLCAYYSDRADGKLIVDLAWPKPALKLPLTLRNYVCSSEGGLAFTTCAHVDAWNKFEINLDGSKSPIAGREGHVNRCEFRK